MIKALITKIKQSSQSESLASFDISIVATALLLEVAKADHQHKESESQAILQHCKNAFSLSTSQAESLIQEATTLSNSATSIWEHTDLINKHMESGTKYNLILDMWKIAFADGEIDRYEEHLIRRVSDLIYIPHTLFIKAKHEASNIIKNSLP